MYGGGWWLVVGGWMLLLLLLVVLCVVCVCGIAWEWNVQSTTTLRLCFSQVIKKVEAESFGRHAKEYVDYIYQRCTQEGEGATALVKVRLHLTNASHLLKSSFSLLLAPLCVDLRLLPHSAQPLPPLSVHHRDGEPISCSGVPVVVGSHVIARHTALGHHGIHRSQVGTKLVCAQH